MKLTSAKIELGSVLNRFGVEFWQTADANLDCVFIKNTLFYIDTWLWKANRIEVSHYPHLEPLCGHKTAQQSELCKTNPLFVFIAMHCLVRKVWVCWIQFKVVIIIEGLSAWQLPLFMDFFCPNSHEYAVMTRSAQYQYFVIDLTSIIPIPISIISKRAYQYQ